MKTLKIFDDKNYQPIWKKYKRDSSRAIIFVENKLVMIKSEKYGEYKFPGGGINPNETQIDALIRETKEETGLHILINSIKPYGKTIIRRKSKNENEIFEQESFYYLCDIDKNKNSKQNLDDGYETEYKYNLVFATIEEAITANSKLLDIPDIPWVKRDLYVLNMIKDEKTMTNFSQSVAAVVIKEEKVLLVRHTYGAGKGKLIIPGGYVNIGESPQDAVRREVFEETKIQVEPVSIIGVRFNIRDWYVVFKADYIEGTAHSDGKENSEVVWVQINEVQTRDDVPDLTKKLVASAHKNNQHLEHMQYEGNIKHSPYSLYC